VEIESKRASILDLVDPVEINVARRQERWRTYFMGKTPVGSKKKRQILMAMVDGLTVGLIAGHLTSRHNMDAEIQSLFVLIQHQRKGIGSGLLEALAVWLLEERVFRVCVGIKAQSPYRSFYLKHGAKYLNEHWLCWNDIHSRTSQNA
jgi:predicted acetyltransferase